MSQKPPTPVCQSFIVCRHIIQDQFTKDYVLLAPSHVFRFSTFPTIADLSLLATFTSIHGVYQLELQLQDLEGAVVWRGQLHRPWEGSDPLQVGTVCLRHQGIYLPKPGKYELVLLANAEQVLRTLLLIEPPMPPAVKPST